MLDIFGTPAFDSFESLLKVSPLSIISDPAGRAGKDYSNDAKIEGGGQKGAFRPSCQRNKSCFGRAAFKVPDEVIDRLNGRKEQENANPAAEVKNVVGDVLDNIKKIFKFDPPAVRPPKKDVLIYFMVFWH